MLHDFEHHNSCALYARRAHALTLVAAEGACPGTIVAHRGPLEAPQLQDPHTRADLNFVGGRAAPQRVFAHGKLRRRRARLPLPSRHINATSRSRSTGRISALVGNLRQTERQLAPKGSFLPRPAVFLGGRWRACPGGC